MTKCGCNPSPDQFEFQIEDISNDVLIIEPIIPNITNLEELKKKIICEYLEIINKLKCGIQPDLEFLLEEISLVWKKIISFT